jgi:hypothetical protein
VSQKVKYVSGARVVVKLNKHIVTFANSISWEVATSHTPLYTIDRYLPYELMPTMITVRGTIGGFRRPEFSPTSYKFQSNIQSFLFNRYITIEVYDSVNPEMILIKVDRAVINRRSETYKAGQLGQIMFDWEGIGFEDYRMPKAPPIGYNK